MREGQRKARIDFWNQSGRLGMRSGGASAGSSKVQPKEKAQLRAQIIDLFVALHDLQVWDPSRLIIPAGSRDRKEERLEGHRAPSPL